MSIRLPDRIWNEDSDNFKVGRLAPLPRGYIEKKCPKCHGPLTGAIICFPNGRAVIPTADDADPNILCISCGYWADAL